MRRNKRTGDESLIVRTHRFLCDEADIPEDICILYILAVFSVPLGMLLGAFLMG